MFFNDPTAAEFYPRRMYSRTERLGSNFCIMNNACAPAYRDWDAATGIQGLMTSLRAWHQPDGEGSDKQISEVVFMMIELAVKHGHLETCGTVWRKTAKAA